MAIALTTHGRLRIRTRFGSGIAPEKLARRAWDKEESPDPSWKVPVKEKTHGMYHYRRYGDCVFIFGKGRYGDMVLVTVVGPFVDGECWEPEW